jgi:hypothetical protein
MLRIGCMEFLQLKYTDVMQQLIKGIPREERI